MDFEQKYAALMALVGWQNICLKMREPGDWYLSVDIGVSEGESTIYPTHQAPTPQHAIHAAWHEYVTSLADNEHIVVSGPDGETKHVSWNGFMWEPVKLPESAV